MARPRRSNRDKDGNVIWRFQIMLQGRPTMEYIHKVLATGYKDAPTEVKTNYSRLLTGLEVGLERGDAKADADKEKPEE